MRQEDGSVTVSFKVDIKRGPKGTRRAVQPKSAPQPFTTQPIDPDSVPRKTRMLVLGYRFERLVREGRVNNYAEIATLTGLSRARVTQIVNLTLLAPGIQDQILSAGQEGVDRASG